MGVRHQEQISKCSRDVSLQDLGSGWISKRQSPCRRLVLAKLGGAQKSPRQGNSCGVLRYSKVLKFQCAQRLRISWCQWQWQRQWSRAPEDQSGR